MIGIIIAAGLGSRMKPFTRTMPKCLLPIAGRPLIERTVDNMRAAGCHDIVLVLGHLAETVAVPGVFRVMNSAYRDNNILHSLMCARDYLEGPILVSYCDIWVEPEIHRTLVATPGDIVLAVDRDWMPYYEGRFWHPLAEAEKVFFDGARRVVKIGKHLDPAQVGALTCGEFLGLWRMSAEGTERFRRAFESIDRMLAPDMAFQQARNWIRAYVTDLVQEMVDAGCTVDCALVERGWAELDTIEDYERLPEIASRQRLNTLVRAEARS